MSDFKTRLETEKSELEEKLNKLDAFLNFIIQNPPYFLFPFGNPYVIIIRNFGDSVYIKNIRFMLFFSEIILF